MAKFTAALVGLLALPAVAVAQPDAELIIGWLDYRSGAINQDLAVRDNARRAIGSVKIGCRFLQYTKQLAAGSVEIDNIAPDGTGYRTMSVPSKTSPNRAECRIISVIYTD